MKNLNSVKAWVTGFDKAAMEVEDLDEDDRNELVFEMEQMLLDDNSFIVFCNGTNTYITSDRVSGYAPNPSNYYYLTADVDLDGGITSGDARLILRAAVGLEDPGDWVKA